MKKVCTVKVMLRFCSFCGVISIEYQHPLSCIFPNTLNIGTSSFGNSKSTLIPNIFNCPSMSSAYLLWKNL